MKSTVLLQPVITQMKSNQTHLEAKTQIRNKSACTPVPVRKGAVLTSCGIPARGQYKEHILVYTCTRKRRLRRAKRKETERKRKEKKEKKNESLVLVGSALVPQVFRTQFCGHTTSIKRRREGFSGPVVSGRVVFRV